jgi:hypothetical protein
MPFTMLRHDRSKFATAAGLLAAVALGGWLGNWVIGPAVSNDRVDRPPLPSAKLERAMIDAMSARPDPSPYRTATPKFEVKDAPDYSAFAKTKAQAAIGPRFPGHGAPEGADAREGYFDLPAPAREAFGYASDHAPRPSPYRKLDRHTGVVY